MSGQFRAGSGFVIFSPVVSLNYSKETRLLQEFTCLTTRRRLS
jgi:hypothetical protein